MDDIHANKWEEIEGSYGSLFQSTIAEDPETGDYTRLTKFRDGCNTESFGAKSHDSPEEISVVSGRRYDKTFDLWLEPGYYASRPPGERHGPSEPHALCRMCRGNAEAVGPGIINRYQATE